MAKASDNVFPRVIQGMNTADQAAPADSSWRVYAKANGIFARSSNSIVGPFSAGAGSGVATDTIWDAKGDLAGGTGADTAAKLTVGTNGLALVADSTQTTGLKWGVPSFIGCHVYNSTTQTLTTSTETTILFDSEESDSSAFHDTGSNTGRITIPTGLTGKYEIRASFFFNTAPGTAPYAYLRANGTTELRGGQPVITNTAGGYWHMVTPPLALSAADYVEVRIFQNAGGNVNIGHASAPGAQSSFSCIYLGA